MPSRQVWGRSYATEAAVASLHFGFEQAHLESIIGLAHPENTRSVRVLEKFGLTCIDRITLWDMDMTRYRLLRSDFERLSHAP